MAGNGHMGLGAQRNNAFPLQSSTLSVSEQLLKYFAFRLMFKYRLPEKATDSMPARTRPMMVGTR